MFLFNFGPVTFDTLECLETKDWISVPNAGKNWANNKPCFPAKGGSPVQTPKASNAYGIGGCLQNGNWPLGLLHAIA